MMIISLIEDQIIVRLTKKARNLNRSWLVECDQVLERFLKTENKTN